MVSQGNEKDTPSPIRVKACLMRGGNSEACWASSIAARLFRVAIEVRLIAGLILRYRPLNLLQRLTSAKAALRELRAPQLVILPARFAYAPPRKPLVNHIFKDFANESCF